MSHKTNPLEIPEIVRLVGRFLEKSSEIAAMKVSKGLHANISVTAWESIAINFGYFALYRTSGRDRRLLPWTSLNSYGSHVRTITMTSGISGGPRPPSS